MTFINFIEQLENLNVNLSLDENDNIKVSASKGTLKQEHLETLKRFKPELVNHLKKVQAKKTNEIESFFNQEMRAKGYKAPCSAMQKGMWLTDRLQSESSIYNMSGAFEILGQLNIALLQSAFQQLITEHDVLRTRFLDEQDELWQCVDAKVEFTINIIKSSNENLADNIQKEATSGFDLEQPCLMRVTIFQVTDQHNILALTLHHIIADGWSLQLLMKQLNGIYTAMLNQSASIPTPHQLQFSDFTQWQANQLALGTYQSQLNYWIEKLKDQAPLLVIPSDRQRPAKQNFSGNSVAIVFSEALMNKLESVCKEHNVTLFMLLLAGFKVLLARYCNINDLSIGTPIANRSAQELESVVGVLVNTVVLRSKIDVDVSFLEYLNDIKETALNAFANSQVPFEQVVSEINPERSASFHPLCQVFFAYQHQAETQIQLGDLDCKRVPHQSQISKVDMTLILNASEQGMTGHFEYATALFDRSTIEHLAESYMTLLGDISENPDKKPHEFSLLSEKQHNLLAKWQGKKTHYPKRIDRQVSSYATTQPNAIAASCDGKHMTYRALEDLANQLAENLIHKGIKQGDSIGVFLRPCLELPAILLGILKASCSYVPLDPRYPDTRLNLMIKDSAINTIIGQNEFKHRIDPHIVFHDVKKLDVKSKHLTVYHHSSDSDLLCIKYTSGSTGKPKGVRLTHQNVLRLVVNPALFGMDNKTVMLQYSSLSFDASAFEIWAPLINGGQIYITDPDHISPADLFDYLRQNPINSGAFTTSLFNELFNHHVDVLSQLRMIICAGEAFNPQHAQKIIKLLPNVRVFNGYGPTENGILSCHHRLNPDEDYRHTVPIGTCVNNSTAYVLDNNLELLPVGAAGELWVGGDGLAQGYHQKPQLTAERFIWHKQLNQRLYRTGDFARMRHDGQLIYLGRTDNQIKLRGHRIEIEEIEAQLMNLPDVTHAAVFCEGESAEKFLIAYVRIESDLTESDIQFALQKVLPAYMVPTLFRLMDVVPITTNGKLDRDALRNQPFNTQTETLTTASELQKNIIKIWQDTLNVNQIDLHSNFFQTGGNSLSTIRLLAKIKECFNIAVPAADFLINPTPAHLSRLIEQNNHTEKFKPITAKATSSLPILSLSQKRLWLMQEISQGNALYNISAGIHFCGQLNVTALQTALYEILNAHPIFRSQIVNKAGVPKLVYHDKPWQMQAQPCSFDLSVEKTQQLTDLVNIAASKDFDLSKDWLIRAKLYTFSDQEHFLVLCVHHIISDGWSIGLMLSELSHRYFQHEDTNNGSQGTDTTAETSTNLHYHDFAHWQQNLIKTPLYHDQIDYWCQTLKDIPSAVSLPYKLTAKDPQQFQSKDCFLDLSKDLTDSIKQLAAANRVSVFSVLLTTFHALIARLSNHVDLTIGMPSAGRHIQGTEKMLGFFVNTLAIRHRWDLETPYHNVLAQMATHINDALNNQDVPYDNVVKAVKPAHGRGEDGLFKLFFNMLNLPESTFELPNLSHQIIHADDSASKFDLTMYVKEINGGFSIRALYDAVNFEHMHIKELLTQYQSVLQQAIASPEASVSSWSLFTETTQSLMHSNASASPSYSDKGVIKYFERQVAANPEMTALSSDGIKLSYEELYQQVNKMADWLLNSGIKQRQIIGIYADRSPELVIALLATLKINGVFVVLDSSYPTETIQTRITAVNPVCVIQCNTAIPKTLADHLNKHEIKNICFRDLNHEVSIIDRPEWDIKPTDTAYLAFTSGTTGQSRVVIGTHRGLERAVLNWTQYDTFKHKGLKFSLLSGLGHDPLHRDIFLALGTGGQLYIPDADDMEPLRLSQWMKNSGIQVANLTPAMLSLLLIDKSQNYSELKWVMSVGEALPWSLVRALKRVSNAEVYNLYGTTETQQCLSHYHCPADAEDNQGIVPIGYGLSGTQVMTLRPDGQLAGIGEVAEIAIISDGLAQGYLNANDEAFFTTESGNRGYKTGDLGILLGNGSIQVIGRSDRQMTIRGFRVEPAEIEQELMRQQDINAAYVCKKQNLQGQEFLLAYVKTKIKTDNNNSLERQQQSIMSALKQKLPAYMLPTSIVQLADFPLTPNGKIDQTALPLPANQSRLQNLEDDRITQFVAQTWAKVLDIKHPTHDVDFFQLGGHSLLAARVIAHIQSELQVTVSLKEFFAATQLSQLSQLIQTKHNKSKTNPLVAVDRRELIPLSLQQNRLWVLNELDFNKSLYNISAAYRLHGNLNTQAFETTFKNIIERHEILRTSFRKHDGQSFQHIENKMEFSITEQSVSTHEINTRIKQEAQLTFEIDKAPLLRVKLLKLSHDERILLITFHHLIFDGGSWAILMQEISQNYNAILNNTTAVLKGLPVQFADYAHWQKTNVDSGLLSQQLDYWVQHLNGLTPLLHLPTKQPRPARQRFEGDLVPINIDSHRLQQLSQFSQAHGVTLHMTLLTIFQVLLAKLSGQDDIAVGTPVANRSHVELENLIGFFVNTLVIRNNIKATENFLTILQNLKETSLGAYENQDVPFEQIVEALQPERSLSNSPLFQVLFSLQNASVNTQSLNGIEIESAPYQSHSSRFDLVLNLHQSDKGLQGYLEYDVDLFEKTTIVRWLNHFVMLIDNIISDANRPIHDLSMLSKQDKTQLQRFSSGPIKAIQTHAGIHGLIKKHDLKSPDAIAITQGQDSITYAELNKQAEIIARWLQSQGLRTGQRVGINMARQANFFIVMLAVLKAGGSYVPIDPTYPHKRQQLIAEDADLFLLISASKKTFEDIKCISWQELLQQSTDDAMLPELNQLDDYSDLPAYIIYTSGSSGQPKGVSIKHGGLCNMIVDQIECFDISVNDRVLQCASLSFDVSIKETFLALASCASLILPEEQHGKTLLESLQSQMSQHKVTAAILLPTVLPHLNPNALPDLRLVYTGAEVVPAHMANLWSKTTRFVNAYGPTEATVMATAHECSTELTVDPPIGQPIANSHVLILSEHDEWCGIGITGEICIMGPGVADGYWRQDENNNSRFVEFSFNGSIHRMYRTGDMGRWNQEGLIEFMGRKDNQIKIRGFRIEIDEIVATLQQCENVSEVVVVVDKETEHARLLAYFVGNTTVEAIREHAKSTLPAHMVPSATAKLDAIPYTDNLKVDYSQLPPIEQALANDQMAKPRNELEDLLLSCWSKALGTEQLGIFDNFFDMGGDSILALQAVSLCQQEGIEITAKQIFEYQNIAEITAVCKIRAEKTQHDETQHNQTIIGPVILTPIQQWFFKEIQQHIAWFNQGIILKLTQKLSVNELSSAFNMIIQHHDILRAQYLYSNGQWQQSIPEPSNDNITIIEKDLSQAFQQIGPESIVEFCSQLQSQFTLEHGKLITAALIHLGAEESRLVIFAHHLIIDGVSWRIILEDLQSLCLGKPLLPSTDSYQAYANHCQTLLADSNWTQQRDYWQKQAQRPYKLPLDKTGENTVGSSQIFSCELSQEETNTLLKTASMSFKMNITDVLLAALLKTLQQWCDTDAISINLESHGRNAFAEQVNLTRTVGWCTSLYPLLFDINDLTSDQQLLQCVKDTSASVPNQGLGFGLLQYSSDSPITDDKSNLPEIGFNYLGQFDQTFQGAVLEPASESTGNLSHTEQIRTQKLSINALVKNNRMKINWIYSKNLHEETTIENLASQFSSHLQRLMHVCESAEAELRAEDFIDSDLNQNELDDLFDDIDF